MIALVLVTSPHSLGLCVGAHGKSPKPGGVGTRTVGVDFGLRRVGVAISSGFAPLPISVLKCEGEAPEDFERVAASIATVAEGEDALQIVLGMPYNSSGGEGEQAVVTREFGTVLANAVAPRPVFLWDERFSSAEAQMRMNAGRGAARGESIDAIAAAVILEDFFAADADALQSALCVPPTKPKAVSRARLQTRKAPPLSASQVRRQMMERVASLQGGTQGQGPHDKRQKNR